MANKNTDLDLGDIYAKYLTEPEKAAKPEAAIVYGKPGSGKSHTAATTIDLPGVKRGLIIDTEGSTVGVVKDPRWSIIRVDKYPDEDRLNAIAGKQGIPAQEVDIQAERFKFLNTILSDTGNGIFNPANKNPFDVVVVDTFDVAQDMAQYYYLEGPGRVMTRNGEVDGFAAWREIANWSNGVAQNLKRMNAFGVMVIHDKEEKANSGAVQRLLRLSGSSKDTLPSIPDMVMYLDRVTEEDEYATYAYFGTTDGKVTKDRFQFPSVVKNVTFPKLFAYIDRQAEKEDNED